MVKAVEVEQHHQQEAKATVEKAVEQHHQQEAKATAVKQYQKEWEVEEHLSQYLKAVMIQMEA
jgi:hypothetical protein